MDPSVLYILPNDRIIETVQRVMQRCGCQYPVYYGSMDKALEIAERMVGQRTKVVVSTGLTALHLRRHLAVPVLELLFTNVEFANAIREAQRYSNKILLVASTYVNYFIQRSLELLPNPQVDVHTAILSLDRPFSQQVQEYLDNGDYDVVISSTPGVKQARANGKIGILFDVDEKMVEFSLQNARALVEFEVHREERDQLVHAVMNYASEGMIITDGDGQIMQLNAAAEKILDLPGRQARGVHWEALFRERGIVDILAEEPGGSPREGTPVFLRRRDIAIGGRSMGMLLSLHNAEDLRLLEQSARKTLELKGHVASRTLAHIIGRSEAIRKTRQTAKRFAWYNSTVLISGETGTGKELFAQGIHNESARRDCAFLAVNCAALPEHLLESELFGYVKGAFTGARSEGRKGLFEAADGGTIFLDEISEVSPGTQALLLRVIQERQIVRIGDDKVIPVDVRIIAASNQNLLELVGQGRFRADLYYRLSVLELCLPPLRERREDIEPIVNSLLASKNKTLNTRITGVDPEAMAVLSGMDWPGNIRQLSNYVERLMILTDTPVVTLEDLQNLIPAASVPAAQAEPEGTLAEMQRFWILRALERTGGSQTAAAQRLGIHPTTLWRKLKEYGIH